MMHKLSAPLILVTFVFLLLPSCGPSSLKNPPDDACGLIENECDLCSEIKGQSKFVVAVVGDGVDDDKPAMAREYSINRAQGEAMWKGINLAYQSSKEVREIKDVVTIKRFDDGGSGVCAKKIAECIYKNACVLAVIGHVTSYTTQLGAFYYEKGRIPLLMPIATSPNVFFPVDESPSVKRNTRNLDEHRFSTLFRLPPSDDAVQAYAMGYVAVEKLHGNRIYVLGDSKDNALTYSRPIYDKLDQEVLGRFKFKGEQVQGDNASEIAKNIRRLKPDVLIYAGYWSNLQTTLAALGEEYSKEKVKPRILLSDGCMSNDLETYGFDVFITFPSPDIFDPSIPENEELKQLRDLRQSQERPFSYEIFGYDSLYLLTQAIQRIRSKKNPISRSAVVEELNGTDKEFKGVAFNYKFVNGENVLSRYYLFDAKTKRFEAISERQLESFKSDIRLNIQQKQN